MRIGSFLGRLLIVLAVIVESWHFSGRPHSISQWWHTQSGFTTRYARPAGLVSAALLGFYLLFFSLSAITYKRRGYDVMGSGCLWAMAGLVAVLGTLLALGFALRLDWLIAFAAVLTLAPTVSVAFGLIAESIKKLRKKWTQAP